MLLSLYDGILCQIEPYPGGTRFAASAGKVVFSNHLSTTYHFLRYTFIAFQVACHALYDIL